MLGALHQEQQNKQQRDMEFALFTSESQTKNKEQNLQLDLKVAGLQGIQYQ